ncbi:MAG: aldo/keto reductase [Spirochaetales bacterium]|nr:aldo/keto reductase [Candidatus Physcosoma equi]
MGNSNITVSRIALGTWGLGGGSVWTDGDSTEEDARNLLSACLENGINYIDTAPVYGTGESEVLLGKALKGRRGKFILQSKCSLNWRQEGGNFHYERDGYTVNNDTRPEATRKDVEDSLRRMGTDYLDSVIVHYVCSSWPPEDTVSELEKMVKDGLIRTYGLSNSQPKDLEEYQKAGGHVA